MTAIFFPKMFKILFQKPNISKTSENNWKKVFTFGGNCIWTGYFKFSLLRREYFWPAVNVLKNSSEIFPITKRNLIAFTVINKLVFSQIHQLWRSSFLWNFSKFYLHFENSQKDWEKAFSFFDNCISIGCVNLSIKKRKFVTGGKCVNKQSEDFTYYKEKRFPTQLPSHCSLNMLKMLWLRFK